MKINGTILENIAITENSNDDILAFDDNSYFSLDGVTISSIYRKKFRPYTSIILLDGLWVADDNRNLTEYFDAYNRGNSYPPIPFTVADMDVRNNQLVASTSGVRKSKLISLELGSNTIIDKEFVSGLRFVLDEEFIFTRSGSEKLIECYSYELEKIWAYSNLTGLAYIDFERKPQIHHNLLIINHAYDIIALNKNTGEEVWKYTFEAIPTSNILINEKIYAVCQAHLYIIDPDNGSVLLTADTGYPARFEQDNKINRVGVFPVGDYLYGIADSNGTEGKLKLFNQDASEVLDVVDFPDYYINPFLSIKPVVYDGKIYQTVRNGYSYSDSGTMVLAIVEDDAQAGISIAKRPPVKVVASPSLSESHKLQVYLDVDNLDDALRYGDLITKEVYFATGFIPMWHERKNALDTKHNGELELIIDDAGFEAGSDELFISMTDRFNEFIETNTCRAGDKKTAIQFSLTCLPKSQWPQTGESLDWPKIRDQETPLI